MSKRKFLAALLAAVMMMSTLCMSAAAEVIQIEESGKTYTAMDLADKSLAEIVKIMGGDFSISMDLSMFYGGYYELLIYIHNDKTLPGMNFYLNNNSMGSDYQTYSNSVDFKKPERPFNTSIESQIKKKCTDGKYIWNYVVLTGTAKLNKKIAANMNYDQTTKALGFDFDGTYVNGGYIVSSFSSSVQFVYRGTSFSTVLKFNHNMTAAELHAQNPAPAEIKVNCKNFGGRAQDYGTIYDVTPPNPAYDVNSDGSVNSSDALFILRISAGLEKPSQAVYKKSDVNGDGKVTSADALLVLRSSVGY